MLIRKELDAPLSSQGNSFPVFIQPVLTSPDRHPQEPGEIPIGKGILEQSRDHIAGIEKNRGRPPALPIEGSDPVDIGRADFLSGNGDQTGDIRRWTRELKMPDSAETNASQGLGQGPCSNEVLWWDDNRRHDFS
jgi:hypothetical protein